MSSPVVILSYAVITLLTCRKLDRSANNETMTPLSPKDIKMSCMTETDNHSSVWLSYRYKIAAFSTSSQCAVEVLIFLCIIVISEWIAIT